MDDHELKRLADAVSKLEVNQDELDGLRLGTNKGVWKDCGLYVIEHPDGQFGVVDDKGHIIVPFGLYGWIDRFSYGLARVRTAGDLGRSKGVFSIVDLETNSEIRGEENIKQYIAEDRKKHPDKYAKWGIINEKGEEVLPVEYDDVWGFYGMDICFTTIEKNGKTERVSFVDLNPSLKQVQIDYKRHERREDYEEYSGLSQFYDYEGFLDESNLEDAYLDGEWMPDDV